MSYFSFIPFELSEIILSFLFVHHFNSFIHSNFLYDLINCTTVYNLHFISEETYISYSKYLKDLSIEKIKFVFKLSDSIEEIINLKKLNLYKNKIKEIPAPLGSKKTCLRKEIGSSLGACCEAPNLIKLQKLYLNNNEIKEIPASYGSKETCLRKKIGSSLGACCEAPNLINLQTLSLSNNEIKEILDS